MILSFFLMMKNAFDFWSVFDRFFINTNTYDYANTTKMLFLWFLMFCTIVLYVYALLPCLVHSARRGESLFFSLLLPPLMLSSPHPTPFQSPLTLTPTPSPHLH